ncbi:MAG TPA: M48 family metalloprotease, partial [Candidatus Bathyarchaeia archaeon]|nr:M48 family metalloprotease [Candidatus Bathyarchaeia archaeon]
MQFIKQILAAALCPLLVLETAGCGGRAAKPNVPLVHSIFTPLQKDLQKPYLDLFREAPELEYSPAQIQQMRDYVNEAKDYCVTQFKQRHNQLHAQMEQAQKDLKENTSHLSDPARHNLHCKIQNLRAEANQDDMLANHAIPVAYENKEAKLDLIQRWPADLTNIRAQLADGAYLSRRWGDVKDIGFRQIEPGQKDDIKAGQDAIKQMKLSGLMPKELDDPAIVNYVTGVAQKVAAHSDLHVPLHVTVLNSKEINAFALPGGFLFIERGLLDAADDESELAGVIGHELGHDVARHGHRLMKRATIESIFYQAAEVAAVVLTGGVAGIGTYYALQYGFYGLGLVLDLQLLGVSREYELEADQLGLQYAWNSGYDPNGFIRFFDKMATKEGYVNGVSWFRTHPPFYERMVNAEREMMFLPKKQNLIVQTDAFLKMKKELSKVTAKAKNEEKNQPSLLATEQGCPAPHKYEYKTGEPIEDLCSLPGVNSKTSKPLASLAAVAFAASLVVCPRALGADNTGTSKRVSLYVDVEKGDDLVTGLGQNNFRLFQDGEPRDFTLAK